MTDSASPPGTELSPTGPSGIKASDSGHQFFERTDWFAFGATALVTFTVYLNTLAPEVTLEFSGILSTSAAYAGVGYPPGFPAWTLYSWLFTKLIPIGNIAWRVAVGSAVAAALASGLVALMVSRSGAMFLETTSAFIRPTDAKALRAICGFVAGMALGLSQTVWQLAVVAERWTFGILLFSIMLTLLLRWVGGPGRRRLLYAASFVFGLLLTSNQELVLVTPALLLLILLANQELGRDLALPIVVLALADWLTRRFWLLWLPGWDYMAGNIWLVAAFLFIGVGVAIAIYKTRRFGSEWKTATLCVASFLLGLCCYFYLPLTSMTNPPVNWGYPRTVEGFFHLISRGQYERPYPTNAIGLLIRQSWAITKETWKAFGWPYFLFIPLPCFVLHRAGRCTHNWLLGLMGMFLCTGPLMVALLNPPADLASTESAAPWFAAMFVVLASWVGLGLVTVGCLVARPQLNHVC